MNVKQKKPHPLGFTVVDGCIVGPLKVGIKIDGVVHKDFTMRGALLEDMLDAEKEASVDTPLNFNACLMTRQLVRVGSYTDPVTVGMLGRMKPVDWRILRAAQNEADALGEDESASAPAS
jgi:hypothetical protein